MFSLKKWTSVAKGEQLLFNHPFLVDPDPNFIYPFSCYSVGSVYSYLI